MRIRNIFTNNWIVITGAPCSGKTTLLAGLEKMGFRVEFEIARQYIDEKIKAGLMLSQIRADELEFQKEVLRRKIAFEKTLPGNNLVFLERGIPDSITYFSLQNDAKNTFLHRAVAHSNYRKIFILKLLKYKKDYARTESEQVAKKLHKMLKHDYRAAGFEVIEVPVMPVAARIKFIIGNL